MGKPRSTEPNDVLNFTQNVRYAAVDELTQGGTRMPEKMGDLIQVLNGMDQAALTTRKLNIEQSAVDNAVELNDTFRKLQKMMKNEPVDITPSVDRIGPPEVDLGNLPDIELMPGEDAQQAQTLNVVDYISND